MLLVIDVGNTNTSYGVFDGPTLLHHVRSESARARTADEYAVLVRQMLALRGVDPEKIDSAILASVVPPLNDTMTELVRRAFGREPLVVGPGIRTGMSILYENPREVGADRIVNAVAAFELLGGPVIAVDFGTATTFDCVSAKGEYLGGAIFPGILVAMEALFSRASMLHRIEIARPRSVIGRTTTQSLQSGLLFGYAGMVDAMVERIRGELGHEARVIATGGLAQRVASETKSIERVEPFLTLEGLRMLFEKNRGHAEAPAKE
jgi:type III pantothenate kinase